MALGLTHRVSGGNNTDQSSYTATGVNVSAGDIVCFFVTNASTAGTAEELDPGDIGGTLGLSFQGTTPGSALASVLMNSSLRARTTFGWAYAASGATGVTITFNFFANQASCQWTVFTISGADTTNPVVQVDTLQTADNNPDLAMSPAPAADGLVAAAINVNSGTAPGVGSGWTGFGSGINGTSPSCRMACEYDATSPDNNITFTFGSAVNKGVIGVEFREPVSASIPYNVIVGGAKKTVVSEKVIVGGAKKDVVNKWVIIGGEKKALV